MSGGGAESPNHLLPRSCGSTSPRPTARPVRAYAPLSGLSARWGLASRLPGPELLTTTPIPSLSHNSGGVAIRSEPRDYHVRVGGEGAHHPVRDASADSKAEVQNLVLAFDGTASAEWKAFMPFGTSRVTAGPSLKCSPNTSHGAHLWVNLWVCDPRQVDWFRKRL